MLHPKRGTRIESSRRLIFYRWKPAQTVKLIFSKLRQFCLAADRKIHSGGFASIKASLDRAPGNDTIPNPTEGCTYAAASRTSSLSEAKISTRRISSKQCKRPASMCVQATLWPAAILRWLRRREWTADAVVRWRDMLMLHESKTSVHWDILGLSPLRIPWLIIGLFIATWIMIHHEVMNCHELSWIIMIYHISSDSWCLFFHGIHAHGHGRGR